MSLALVLYNKCRKNLNGFCRQLNSLIRVHVFGRPFRPGALLRHRLRLLPRRGGGPPRL